MSQFSGKWLGSGRFIAPQWERPISELPWIRSGEVQSFAGMPHGLTSLVTSVIGGGVGAGIVTFALNFWKGERALRRRNLERLYAAVHKYSESMSRYSLYQLEHPAEHAKELLDQFDLISLLIDLYFPELRPALESFKKKQQHYYDLFTPKKAGTQKEIDEAQLQTVEAAKDLKQAVVALTG